MQAVLDPVKPGKLRDDDRAHDEPLDAGQAARGHRSANVEDALLPAVDVLDGPSPVAANFVLRPSPTRRRALEDAPPEPAR
jgi:hypothetical protein